MSAISTMMKITSTLDGVPTFKLIPTDLNCPYNEAVFHPGYKLLVVVAKEKYNSFQFIPRINDNGDYEITKGTGKRKEQRVLLEMCHEYKITDKEEIKSFINFFTGKEQDLEEYFKVPEAVPVSTDSKLEVVKDGE